MPDMWGHTEKCRADQARAAFEPSAKVLRVHRPTTGLWVEVEVNGPQGAETRMLYSTTVPEACTCRSAAATAIVGNPANAKRRARTRRYRERYAITQADIDAAKAEGAA